MRCASRSSAALGLVITCTTALAAETQAASAALCTPAQRVMFHCALREKAVSLCADVNDGRIAALTYRFGTRSRIELAHTVSGAAGGRFDAAVSPVAPRASVRQISFARGASRYLMSQCVGADCSRSAGLTALRRGRIVFDQPCRRTADDRAWLSPELARFGSDAASSEALTDLVQFDDDDHGIDRVYLRR